MKRSEATKHAIQILSTGGVDDQKFREMMRAQFPGITNWILREAWADARLIIAFRNTKTMETD